MLKEFYTAALGMVNQQTRLEVTANNMANASTTGFRRQSVFERNLIDARANFYNVKGDAEQNDPPVGSYTDFERGGMQQTNNPLDIAINSKEGFFVLQDEDGKRYLSRAGRFKLESDGSIRAMDGKFLMSNGGPIYLNAERFQNGQDVNDTRFIDLTVTDQGELFSGNIPLGSLLIAVPGDPQTLQRISGSEFIATNITELQYMDQDKIALKQGFIENSNVNIIAEMVEMIELQKHFEAGQKVVTTNDSTLDQAIRIGRYI
jgi:flagellar basal-body rod protein FlgF/flagellar basal-body rod protein FlgG